MLITHLAILCTLFGMVKTWVNGFLCDLWRWKIFLSQPSSQAQITWYKNHEIPWKYTLMVDLYTRICWFWYHGMRIYRGTPTSPMRFLGGQICRQITGSLPSHKVSRNYQLNQLDSRIFTKKSPVHILCKDKYKYVYENTWNPNDPLFLKVNPPKQGLFQLSNKGHLGSRYTLRIQVCPKRGITPIHSYSFRMGLEPEKSYSIREGSGFLVQVQICLCK